jgi:hypothetical protein
MPKKTYDHSCRVDGILCSKKQGAGKKVSPLHNMPGKKEFVSVFNRFYREQVEELYRAVKNGG